MKSKIIEILSEYAQIPADKITDSSRLTGDLGLSSFELIEILVRLENEFHVHLDDRSLPDIQTVGDVIAMLECRRRAMLS